MKKVYSLFVAAVFICLVFILCEHAACAAEVKIISEGIPIDESALSVIKRDVSSVAGLFASELGCDKAALSRLVIRLAPEDEYYAHHSIPRQRDSHFFDSQSGEWVILLKDWKHLGSFDERLGIMGAAVRCIYETCCLAPLEFPENGLVTYFISAVTNPDSVSINSNSERDAAAKRWIKTHSSDDLRAILPGQKTSAEYWEPLWSVFYFLMEESQAKSFMPKVFEGFRHGNSLSAGLQKYYPGGVEYFIRNWWAWVPRERRSHTYKLEESPKGGVNQDQLKPSAEPSVELALASGCSGANQQTEFVLKGCSLDRPYLDDIKEKVNAMRQLYISELGCSCDKVRQGVRINILSKSEFYKNNAIRRPEGESMGTVGYAGENECSVVYEGEEYKDAERPVILHEAGHVFNRQCFGHLPNWFDEIFAGSLGPQAVYPGRIIIEPNMAKDLEAKQWIQKYSSQDLKHELDTLQEKLYKAKTSRQYDFKEMSPVWSVLYFLMEGLQARTIMPRIIQEIKMGLPFSEALDLCYPEGFKGFERQWREWVILKRRSHVYLVSAEGRDKTFASAKPAEEVGRLQGIIFSADSPKAMIAGKLFGVGSEVGGGKIVAITMDTVTIESPQGRKKYRSGEIVN